MIVLLHVIIALASMAYTFYLWFSPTRTKLYVSYGFIAATILSGTYLILSTRTHMLEACMSGLFYLCVVTVGTALAQRKLAHAID